MDNMTTYLSNYQQFFYTFINFFDLFSKMYKINEYKKMVGTQYFCVHVGGVI